MTIRNTYAAEAWDKVYNAFQQINFTSYDYDTVKESLLQYLKIYHAEHFNDFIESSELIAVLELFAYVAELLAYRVDTVAHENFITTAQRKQSVLRLARLISYRASRNIPGRGLVKINSIRTTETVVDSLGNDLSNVTVNWNDPNNSNWKEQFFLVMNKVLTAKFGKPSKAVQVGDVLMQLYTFNNVEGSFRNGVFSFTAVGTGEQLPMEVVPADLDDNGPFERTPDQNAQFNILYANDGRGDGSDFTGFLMFVKQGSLIRTDYTIEEPTANRRLELDAINVNDTDVWVHRVDDDGVIQESWKRVETLSEQNLYFNDDDSSRKKYEVETLENDRIALLFGDGSFSDAPVGNFQIWTRISANQNLTIPKNRVSGQQMSFTYRTQTNVTHNFSLAFSLTSAIENNSASETIEQVRQSAPSTYYAQNRMVNGQDYNTFMLKDPSIVRLKTINRTFAGQPKYIEWNDASRKYENIKLFGDDLKMYMDVSADMIEVRQSGKSIVDGYIEPLLQTNALLNTIIHAFSYDSNFVNGAEPSAPPPTSNTNNSLYGIMSYPRRKFIEDNRQIYFTVEGAPVTPYGETYGSFIQAGDGSLNEKSAIQAVLDQHWYGDPKGFVFINGIRHAVIDDPLLNPSDDGKIYQPDIPRTIDGINTYPPGDVGSGLQQIQVQSHFGLRFNRLLKAIGDGDIQLLNMNDSRPPAEQPNLGYGTSDLVPAEGIVYYYLKIEVITIEMTSDKTTFTVTSNLRGKLPDYSLAGADRWIDQDSSAPFDFVITEGSTAFEPGDAFIIELRYRFIDEDNIYGTPPPSVVQDSIKFQARVRLFGSSGSSKVNLNGWWEIIPAEVISASPYTTPATTYPEIGGAGIFIDGPDDGPDMLQQMTFNQGVKAQSWMFLVSRVEINGELQSWRIYNRNMKIVVESPTTKFWYNQDDQIIDSETKKPVVDKIRILKTNLDEYNRPLLKAQVYDVVGSVYDADGNINFNKLEVLPTDTENFITKGDGLPDRILQFENFVANSYEFYIINVSDPEQPYIEKILACDEYTYKSGYDIRPYDITNYDDGWIEIPGYGTFSFESGNFISDDPDGTSVYRIARRKLTPAPAIFDPYTNVFGCNAVVGLDFMWQHFSPITNLVDPSVTNIHDAFIMTRGYYTSVMDFVRGFTNFEPLPPTPLELRTSYGYLLDNKMLSDTVVMHPGKIKLLFGEKADQKLRAKFRVVKSQTATFSDERIKQEIISGINTYFDIQYWDFGDKFYATELISLIHQKLATQISSVVLVPLYSINSFGSLFMIDSGYDEILQSCADVNDVEIVSEITPIVLRQLR